ncbi:hypothetical protein BDY19DRAFT_250445 [Irpex rosettiformis]|uniref:Uncharacterized protein n=1 Tax=Irpex rosettiformis TaxID=378272 RepID=A0ACB8TZD6_9APHY|nr:hypothetical protein BDY19DRAFT_250445 [Irpex rosettiformis]
MTRLRILAGPSLTNLIPIEPNSDIPLNVRSDAFEGQVAVYIKGLPDESGRPTHSPYFDHSLRKGITWSIQLQGRFLQSHSGDDILFGNIFDRPLKLPWGFGAALKFMKYVDPTLEERLQSRTRPWAFSPFLSTMPHIHHTRVENVQSPLFSFPASTEPIVDRTIDLRTRHGAHLKHTAPQHRKQRKSHFKSPSRRKEVTLGPKDIISADFCHHFLEFGQDSIVLRLPCGLSMDLLRYWDGQPVRFVCAERAKPGENSDGNPWGRIFFCVVIEKVRDDEMEKVEAPVYHEVASVQRISPLGKH